MDTSDSGPDEKLAAALAALQAVRADCAHELSYRRLVAWAACALVGVLLLGAVAGAYYHRHVVAGLEAELAGATALADERAVANDALRAELAEARQDRAEPR